MFSTAKYVEVISIQYTLSCKYAYSPLIGVIFCVCIYMVEVI